MCQESNATETTSALSTEQQVIELVRQMLASGDIGLYARHVDNGADCYVCMSCGQSTPVRGHACGKDELSGGTHYPDCNAVKLAALMAKLPAKE